MNPPSTTCAHFSAESGNGTRQTDLEMNSLRQLLGLYMLLCLTWLQSCRQSVFLAILSYSALQSILINKWDAGRSKGNIRPYILINALKIPVLLVFQCLSGQPDWLQWPELQQGEQLPGESQSTTWGLNLSSSLIFEVVLWEDGTAGWESRIGAGFDLFWIHLNSCKRISGPHGHSS